MAAAASAKRSAVAARLLVRSEHPATVAEREYAHEMARAAEHRKVPLEALERARDAEREAREELERAQDEVDAGRMHFLDAAPARARARAAQDATYEANLRVPPLAKPAIRPGALIQTLLGVVAGEDHWDDPVVVRRVLPAEQEVIVGQSGRRVDAITMVRLVHHPAFRAMLMVFTLDEGAGADAGASGSGSALPLTLTTRQAENAGERAHSRERMRDMLHNRARDLDAKFGRGMRALDPVAGLVKLPEHKRARRDAETASAVEVQDDAVEEEEEQEAKKHSLDA